MAIQVKSAPDFDDDGHLSVISLIREGKGKSPNLSFEEYAHVILKKETMIKEELRTPSSNKLIL